MVLLQIGGISFHESASITWVAIFCVDEIKLHELGSIQVALKAPMHEAHLSRQLVNQGTHTCSAKSQG